MYTDEKNVTILVSLLKKHGIKQVIASPGSANSPFVSSVQKDDFFKIFSSVDERSAAYIACGLAHESNEPVIITCTGATASRNYLSGLTEAFYRKLPVLAITSTKVIGKVGHHIAQVIDRSLLPVDTNNLSLTLPVVKDENDKWECNVKSNQAILELSRNGGGPVHINLETISSKSYKTKSLPDTKKIYRYNIKNELPVLKTKRIAVYVGSHKKWSRSETTALEKFCQNTGSPVYCDHTSGYHGKNRIQISILACQSFLDKSIIKPDLIIYIGEITGDYALLSLNGPEVWRVNSDGQLRDTFGNLSSIFQMEEEEFFNHYSKVKFKKTTFYQDCLKLFSSINKNIPDLPLSNIFLAKILSKKIPKNSVIHFSILNSLRAWNLFELNENVESISNVGGFGIDGCMSSLVGASLFNKNKLYFGIVGDLSFFYDLNVFGNRHIYNNLRIILVNNGLGTEFKQYKHHTAHFNDFANSFICAEGHYGNKSKTLVKNFANSLGFNYISANSKEEFIKNYPEFIDQNQFEKPIIFEVFTNQKEESKALELIYNIHQDKIVKSKEFAKTLAKSILGEKGKNIIKKQLNK